jgi:predicted amidohydrolase
VELLGRAADEGAQLIVLPELVSSGYVFENMDEVVAAAEVVPGGPAVTAWERVCREKGVHVVAGLPERDGDTYYNSCVLVGPEGHLGTYRKVHLWNEENRWFAPGDLGFPVFDTALGRVAMVICYDCWFPEAFRAVAVAGADFVCVPTNWVPITGQDPTQVAMANVLCQAAAHTNSFCVAAADRVGVERGQEFVGQSVIVSHTGWPAAGPASSDGVEILHARVSASEAKAARTWNKWNDPLLDRRPETYRAVVAEQSR